MDKKPPDGVRRARPDPSEHDSRRFLCGLCRQEWPCPGPLLDHLRDAHGQDREALRRLPGKRAAHLDSAAWYQNHTHYFLEGKLVMARITTTGRRIRR